MVALALERLNDLISLIGREVNESPIEHRFVYVPELLDYISREVSKHEKLRGRREVVVGIRGNIVVRIEGLVIRGRGLPASLTVSTVKGLPGKGSAAGFHSSADGLLDRIRCGPLLHRPIPHRHIC